jgi:large subunit ribosomal protein L9e
MKFIVKTERIEVPDDVKISVKSRTVTIEGKRGKITKAFKHLKVELLVKEEVNATTKKKVRFVEINTYLTSYKNSAILYTVGSHIKNMIIGVTKVYSLIIKGIQIQNALSKEAFPYQLRY